MGIGKCNAIHANGIPLGVMGGATGEELRQQVFHKILVACDHLWRDLLNAIYIR